MSDDESFLARWSRRKRGAAPATRAQPKAEHEGGGTAPEVPAASSPPRETPLPVDPASLPPIESIGAGSDIRAFLAAGVPADLTRAALRHAWAADPAIREFIGLSENSWDFNAPGGVPGFGSVKAEDVRRLLARVMGEPETADNAPPAGETPSANQAAEPASESDPAAEPACPQPAAHNSMQDRPEQDGDAGAGHHDPSPHGSVNIALDRDTGERDCGALLPRRGHGGALPE
jgi:uncharacterized protein DUF3306